MNDTPDGPAYARAAVRASARKELAVSIVDERGRPVAALAGAWLPGGAPPVRAACQRRPGQRPTRPRANRTTGARTTRRTDFSLP
jgi:hypothetical protein